MRQMTDMPCCGFRLRTRNDIAGRIAGMGWGLFLFWVGASFLFDLGWGVGLLGVGILTLTMQVVRRSLGLQLEGFWLLAGGAFTLAGVWKLAAIDISLGPILVMALGIVVAVSALLATRD